MRNCYHIELMLENGLWLYSAVSNQKGFWILRKLDPFNRRLRFNPFNGYLEVEDPWSKEWTVYEKFVYKVEITNGKGDIVQWS